MNEKKKAGVRLNRGIAFLLSLVMVISLIPVSAYGDWDWGWILGEKKDGEETEFVAPADSGKAETSKTTSRKNENQKMPEELIVGHTTETKGDFFTEMFGNNTADIDVRALLHGYNLVDWDQSQGVYILDDYVVKKASVTEDVKGNRTYNLTLCEDLYYSDGSHITAWDYAFSLLLMMAPEIEQIGGKIYRAEHILGYEDYILKRTRYLEGVRVKGDYQLAITLDHEFLPYFFEVGLLLCVPYPISVIAPGCRVYDDGFGIYIGNAVRTERQPDFTAELLRKTILDPEMGYNSHPSVVSGPYVMKSYDGVTGHFEVNPYYKRKPVTYTKTIEAAEGDEKKDPEKVEVLVGEGDPGYIRKITFTLADNNTMLQKLSDGELHLVNKVTYGPLIEELMQKAGENNLRYQNYPRIGLSFLTFSYDWPTVQEKEVRQAIAWCMDRDQLTRDYCKGFGVRVDGYYGIEQWEYLLVNGRIDYPVVKADGNKYKNIAGFRNRVARSNAEYERMKQEWEALSLDSLTAYSVNTDKATDLLTSTGWVLNRQGSWYNPVVDDVRCKWIDEKLVALDLKMMYPEGNHIADTLQENFIDNLNKCGIHLTLVPVPMEDLLRSYYRETERTTDMIYLATNFHVVVDPAITYSADNEAVHRLWNNTYSNDRELYELAVDMRKTEPGDIFTYVQKWIRFQERYNEVLPAIPIYSNIYFDFFTDQLQNYEITAHVTWSQAILESFFALKDEEDDPVPGMLTDMKEADDGRTDFEG